MGIKEIAKAALFQTATQKSKAEWKETMRDGTAKYRVICPSCTRALVDLNEVPVSIEALKSGDPNVRLTTGIYSIDYVPKGALKSKPKYPYHIAQDLLNMRLVCSGPKHLRAIANRIPEVAWILRNSNFSNSLFGYAKMHPGMNIPFCLDFVAYGDMIQQKAKRDKIWIDNKPFACFTCNPDKYYDEETKKKYVYAYAKNHYIKELTSAENDADTVKEVIQNEKESK